MRPFVPLMHLGDEHLPGAVLSLRKHAPLGSQVKATQPLCLSQAEQHAAAEATLRLPTPPLPIPTPGLPSVQVCAAAAGSNAARDSAARDRRRIVQPRRSRGARAGAEAGVEAGERAEASSVKLEPQPQPEPELEAEPGLEQAAEQPHWRSAMLGVQTAAATARP